MARGKRQRPGRFWLRLIGVYILLIVVWPLVRPSYDWVLGRLTAACIPLLAIEKTEIRGIKVDTELWWYMTVWSAAQQKVSKLDYHLDVHQYGYGHIIFTALALAVPGWTIRRRLARWGLGTLILQGYFVLMVLLSLFSTVGSHGDPTWRGDVITKIIPADLFLKHRGFLVLVNAGLVPVLVWLGLFVFSGAGAGGLFRPPTSKAESGDK